MAWFLNPTTLLNSVVGRRSLFERQEKYGLGIKKCTLKTARQKF